MSDSTEFYRKNPKARRKKNAYQKEYNKSDKQVAKRVELNKINRRNHKSGKSKVGDSKDVSHTKSGGTVLEKQSRNRARNRGKK